jgi:hypothetical protein
VDELLKFFCRTGLFGEYVKGNYIDEVSNKNLLEGIPKSLTNFQ